jgi:hypothetical protein
MPVNGFPSLSLSPVVPRRQRILRDSRYRKDRGKVTEKVIETVGTALITHLSNLSIGLTRTLSR